MDIEQIALFIVGWFAAGFLVALAIGKFIREANQFDDDLSHATASSRTSVSYLHKSKRKNKRQPQTKTRSVKGARRAAN
jgi:hypothetical protein